MSGSTTTNQTPHAAIDQLYREHHPWLQLWLRKKLGCHHKAADLAQDTFLRLLQRRLNPAPSSRALLTHIAKGLMIDYWRRQDVEQAYLASLALLPEHEHPSPETQVLILETLCRIEAMLRTMPAQTQTIFLLAQLDGLTYAEIATQLDIALITVKRHMRTALVHCLSLA